MFRVLILSVVVLGAVAKSHCYPGGDYDFLALVLQYPPAECPTSAPVECNGANTQFGTIHGLWASKGNQGPCDCGDDPFDYNQITDDQTLYNDMLVYWPTYRGKGQEWFWQHEWEDHGRCATNTGVAQIDSQHAFFQTTMQLAKANNFMTYLAAAGIQPSDDQTVSASQVVQAIASGFGAQPAITCDCYCDDPSQKLTLSSVAVCFTKDLQPTDCTGMENSCDRPFYLPATQQGVYGDSYHGGTCKRAGQFCYGRQRPQGGGGGGSGNPHSSHRHQPHRHSDDGL